MRAQRAGHKQISGYKFIPEAQLWLLKHLINVFPLLTKIIYIIPVSLVFLNPHPTLPLLQSEKILKSLLELSCNLFCDR